MGRHLCRSDGEDYFDLQRHEREYKVLFAALGYTLVHHQQGFYYFTGDSTLKSQRLRQVTLFMLILFQDLEDKKLNGPERSWERALLDRRFLIAELPHFATAQRRTLMDAAGVATDTLDRVLRFLVQLGVVEAPEGNGFRFKAPVYRFVDMFLQFSDDDHWACLEQGVTTKDGGTAKGAPLQVPLSDDDARVDGDQE